MTLLIFVSLLHPPIRTIVPSRCTTTTHDVGVSNEIHHFGTGMAPTSHLSHLHSILICKSHHQIGHASKQLTTDNGSNSGSGRNSGSRAATATISATTNNFCARCGSEIPRNWYHMHVYGEYIVIDLLFFPSKGIKKWQQVIKM
ncbi:uncharacterized protein B0T23DRAFT_113102 [Neurospora hispaniola]|uniref:CENP-V/GFA domain-containing protein n=1 Tax=Neurospora hispaniola TaxID=588809 RepID=A0AAJ0MSD4_9PEZI|nr:hypothetical protein B0T23DRAFT_113102 [Neurospora hispaniola]